MISIVAFREEYSKHFEILKNEWLDEYFEIEEYDKKVLQNPFKYIIEPGGHILFAKIESEFIGTVALIKRSEGVFELAKMSVSDKFKGRKIGYKLMVSAIDLAKEKKAHTIFLDSNRKLKPALSLYKKVGFNEIPVPKNTPYERCDIRMELRLID